MGKIDENKKKKKETLFNSAYDLFVTKGINSTAISDIVEKAGVAKGTFYLYFKDKYDIRNKLIAHKTHELFHEAKLALDHEATPVAGLDEQLIFIIDHIIDTLVLNIPLMNFISKNLVMGALRSVLLTGERSDVGYEDYLKSYAQIRRMKSEELLETLDQLKESAAGFETMEQWFAHMEDYKKRLKEQAQLQRNVANGVSLMTMHSSKGLEFPIVYLLDANEGITPHRKAVLEADIEEERRMFYVAMTRARERLHVCYVQERYGKKQEKSRFIEEYLETGTKIQKNGFRTR